MNTELFLRTRDAILEGQGHTLVMDAFVTKRGFRWFEEILEPEKNICGTACCIAGTGVAIHDGVDLLTLPTVDPGYAYSGPILRRACEVFEVSQHCPVFFLENWPQDLVGLYRSATTDMMRAQIAALAIDRFLADPEGFGEQGEDDEPEEDEDDYDEDDDSEEE